MRILAAVAEARRRRPRRRHRAPRRQARQRADRPRAGPQVYLGDFGLARDPEGATLTAPGQVLGTIDYMAPELLDGERVGAATDIYGLACLAVETLTGTVPFLRDTDAATMYAHIVDPPPSVSERRPELPAALDDVLAAGMAKDPDDRPADGPRAGDRHARRPGPARPGPPGPGGLRGRSDRRGRTSRRQPPGGALQRAL